MPHLRRPDAVENLEPEPLEPAVVNRLRQRLTGGQAEAHRPEVVQPFGVRDLEHRGEGGRYREEQGRPLARENLEHLCRLGAPGVEHGRGAHVEREIQGVAEPVCEEQPGHGEAAVVRADLQYVPPERLAAYDHVVVQVHGGTYWRSARTTAASPWPGCSSPTGSATRCISRSPWAPRPCSAPRAPSRPRCSRSS